MLGLAAGCGGSPPVPKIGEQKPAPKVKAAKATSVKDFGGMDRLVEAAKKEGRLNVIGLPPDWAGYGAIIKAFEEKYKIEVNSAQPDASSQDEINAAHRHKGGRNAPDVFDLDLNVAVANQKMFAPYQVRTWHDIPDQAKDPKGAWYGDYSGHMSIGYNARKVPAPRSFADLLKPAYRGAVALNGDPTRTKSAFSGVAAAALAGGGSAEDVSAGVRYFGQLARAGNLTRTEPTTSTIESGRTPVVIDWDYRNAARADRFRKRDEDRKKVDWKVVVPTGPALSSFYAQAINRAAPHPAAARLWQEFLYSDEGQNLFLRGHTRPIRAEAMERDGKVDRAAYKRLPPVSGTPVTLTIPQMDRARAYVAANWHKTVR
ncbi:extracellular solute-binding protein [Bailinhaonella thermotolerans]|uniref:Extracellular solute-binding protein n=2 Tax=Bailinhaonella thermotolerans TaxID=1070861 RepID=A0A3A4AVI2_9ACTN|nr:extracellular solute-binding protein [Bailinhaonella thermotolerans]